MTVLMKATLAETAKAYTADAIATLVKIMGDESAPASARATCAFGLLDRGHGKPTERIEADVKMTTLEMIVARSYKVPPADAL
jgi:hypothetical protein